MQVTISLRRLAVLLIAVFAALVFAGYCAEYLRYIDHNGSRLINYFSLTEEKNFPTWWSSFLLMACAVVLFTIAATKSRAKGDRRIQWIVLGAIFWYMSVDELVEIHEWLALIRPIEDLHGFLYYSWVIPAGAFVLVFALSYLTFLFHLPKTTRIKVALAGITFVGGAAGIELILGFWTDKHGELNFVWAMIGLVEEAFEIIGSSLFLYALVEYLGRSTPDLRLAILADRDSKGTHSMSETSIGPRSWMKSPWFKWSWLIVLGVIILFNLDYHFRWLPTNAAGYAARGRADYNFNEFERSVKNFTEVIEREPANVEAYIWRGEAYAKLHDIVNASSDLEQALKLRPDYNKAFAAYADVKAAAWDAAGAIPWYGKALEADANYVRLYLERAKCAYDAAQWADAKTDLDKSVSVALDDARITAILLRWAAKAHAGNAYGASVELNDLMKEGKLRGNRFWLSAQFLSGSVPETVYLAEMQKLQGGNLAELTAESHFLAGVKRLVFGDHAGAATLLRESLETGADTSYAFGRARVELENITVGFHPIAGTTKDGGLTVGAVIPGGPAEAAGIRPGSIVTKIDGEAATQESFVELLANTKPEMTVELMVAEKAGAEAKPVTLRLGASSPTK